MRPLTEPDEDFPHPASEAHPPPVESYTPVLFSSTAHPRTRHKHRDGCEHQDHKYTHTHLRWQNSLEFIALVTPVHNNHIHSVIHQTDPPIKT
jgi:hypothetical protein